MFNFRNCQLLGLGALFLGVAIGQEDAKDRVQVRSASNPTGLQVGVQQEALETLSEEGQKLAEAGALASADLDWEAAKKAYEDLLKSHPEHPLALSNLGAVEFRLGEIDEAIALLERASAVSPGIAQNWLTLGLIHHQEGRSELALSMLARAVHEDPGDPRARNYMGVVIRSFGWNSGAETELQRAIALDPTYADAHFNLAVMYLDRTPPLSELARRHYYAALDYGAKPDEEIEKRLSPEQKRLDDE